MPKPICNRLILLLSLVLLCISTSFSQELFDKKEDLSYESEQERTRINKYKKDAFNKSVVKINLKHPSKIEKKGKVKLKIRDEDGKLENTPHKWWHSPWRTRLTMNGMAISMIKMNLS